MPTTLQAYPHRRTTYMKNAVKRKSWKSLFRYALQAHRPIGKSTPRSCSVRWRHTAACLTSGGIPGNRANRAVGRRRGRVLRLMGQFTASTRVATNSEICANFQPQLILTWCARAEAVSEWRVGGRIFAPIFPTIPLCSNSWKKGKYSNSRPPTRISSSVCLRV